VVILNAEPRRLERAAHRPARARLAEKIGFDRRDGARRDMTMQTAAGDFSELDPAIQKLEFKVTVLPVEEPAVEAELRSTGVDPARRKVYFYDTPELAQ
jgi:hypothetical protein